MENSLCKIWSDMICLARPYHFNFFKGSLPQILLGLFLNNFTHIMSEVIYWWSANTLFSTMFSTDRSSHQRCSIKKLFLKISKYSQEKPWAYNYFIKTHQHVFSCEYCKIFQNTYFEEHLRTAAYNLSSMGLLSSYWNHLWRKVVNKDLSSFFSFFFRHGFG